MSTLTSQPSTSFQRVSSQENLNVTASSASILSIVNDETLSIQFKTSHLSQLLRRAASSGDANTVELIVKKNGHIRKMIDVIEHRDSEGSTALILATAFGWSECVRILVEQGADVNGRDGGEPIVKDRQKVGRDKVFALGFS
jgi:ankyrin repeat protein